jgi:hypothetical protein
MSDTDLKIRCESMVKILVGENLAKVWWARPNRAFDGATPESVFDTDPRRVYYYVSACLEGEW